MKKEKSQKPSPPVEPSPTAVPATATDLKAPIRQHSLFFDRLVDLIPARFYLPAPDDDERPWYPGLSKQARASAKKQSRENAKKSRRARLDPDKSSSTLDLLKRRVEADKSGGDVVEGEDAAAATATAAAAASDRPVTYEELRERLHRRIEELRSNRNTRPSGRPKNDVGNKMKWKGKEKGESGLGKRKREEKSQEEAAEKKKKKKKEKPVEEKDRDASAVELSFGHVRLGGVDDKLGKKKKKKLSKLKALQKAKQLDEAKKDPEKGEIVSKKHSWKAAVSRAAGLKVHDDPKLLKESIKKDKKRHQKSVEKWKERVETREKLKVEKQKTRSDNIKERIHQKKVRKIEKREKKLMRPGFEGRKEGYINEN